MVGMVSCGLLVALAQPQVAVHNDSYAQQPHYIPSSLQEFLTCLLLPALLELRVVQLCSGTSVPQPTHLLALDQ